MDGMYLIENTSSEHVSLLEYTVMAWWGERQPDIYLVSKEGVKVYTQRWNNNILYPVPLMSILDFTLCTGFY